MAAGIDDLLPSCFAYVLSAKGAKCESEGQRPWITSQTIKEALKARDDLQDAMSISRYGNQRN